jgi:hypothetical protein
VSRAGNCLAVRKAPATQQVPAVLLASLHNNQQRTLSANTTAFALVTWGFQVVWTMERGAGGAYTGSHASYVALSSITVLALALLSSVWTSDVSGTVGIIGLISVYLGSQEVLMLVRDGHHPPQMLLPHHPASQ